MPTRDWLRYAQNSTYRRAARAYISSETRVAANSRCRCRSARLIGITGTPPAMIFGTPSSCRIRTGSRSGRLRERFNPISTCHPFLSLFIMKGFSIDRSTSVLVKGEALPFLVIDRKRIFSERTRGLSHFVHCNIERAKEEENGTKVFLLHNVSPTKKMKRRSACPC